MDEKENKNALGTEEAEEEDESTGTEKNSGSNNSSQQSATGETKKSRMFSQEQVTRMMTKEKNQGRVAAYNEMGINPNDKKMISMFRAFIESQKTEEQKNAEKDAEEKKKQEEADRRVLVAEAKAEAMMLGVKQQYVNDAVTLALSNMTDSTDLKTALGELKEKYSIWFEADEQEEGKQGKQNKAGKTGQKGTGASIKETTKKSKEELGMGARLASARKTGGAKKSYW